MATNREIIEDPTHLGMLEILDRFSTDEKARKFLEAIRWPEGPVCPHCGNCDKARVYKVTPNKAKKVREGLYKCAECSKQFTVTVGTIFEKSKVPLRKWMLAWYLVCSSKNGISALELQRHLKLGSYRTAWHMLHRIRYALKDPVFDDQLSGEIEADEVYLGGKPKSMKKFMSAAEKKARRIKANAKKMPVVSVMERGGRVRSFSVTKVNGESVREILLEHV
ncbi:MAG: IS1595 family transposase, partial [Chrysiogenetes bacterium]|nr:IS1595 family transposase [Chrysiogenetes bacterium]